MPEKRYVVREEKINYDGYFDLAGLYYVIEDVVRRFGYIKKEDMHDVRVYKTHRELEVKFVPELEISDYTKYIIEVKMLITDMTDVTITVDGKPKKVQKGKIKAKFSGLQKTGYGGQWSGKPSFQVMRMLIDKLIYPQYMGDLEGQLKSHVKLLMHEFSAHLNINKYRFEENRSGPVSKHI